MLELDDTKIVPNRVSPIPTSMECDPGCGTDFVEENIKRSGVRLEAQSWSLTICKVTRRIVQGAVRCANCELLAHLTIKTGDIFWLPRGKALRVAKVATLIRGLRAVQISQEVHLFGWVVLMNVLALI